ncbi:MAG: hypothetical protein ACT4P2_14985 [Pseudomonadota bacterium]
MAGSPAAQGLWSQDSLFQRLRAAHADDWRRYSEREFVRHLAAGTLPEAAFRRYLGQDQLFVIHFARD